MSGKGGHQGVQLRGRYWPTQKTIDLFGGKVESVVVRTRTLFEKQPGRTWTANQVARELHCSYSTARTALKYLHQTFLLDRHIGRDHDMGMLGTVGAKTNEWIYKLKVKGKVST